MTTRPTFGSVQLRGVFLGLTPKGGGSTYFIRAEDVRHIWTKHGETHLSLRGEDDAQFVCTDSIDDVLAALEHFYHGIF